MRTVFAAILAICIGTSISAQDKPLWVSQLEALIQKQEREWTIGDREFQSGRKQFHEVIKLQSGSRRVEVLIDIFETPEQAKELFDGEKIAFTNILEKESVKTTLSGLGDENFVFTGERGRKHSSVFLIQGNVVLKVFAPSAEIARRFTKYVVDLMPPSNRNRNQAQQTAPSPSFDRRLLLETSSETSANVSVGDLNGDGKLDIVLVKGRHWPLRSRVLLGDGKGSFPTAYDLSEKAYRSYSGRLVDIDGDGSLDVVLSNDAPDPKVIYLNDGKGHFRLGPTYGHAEWETRNASIADLNGDSQPDIIVANRSDSGGANYICLNKGRGQFEADCTPFSHYPATTITTADFNHDGRVDLVVPHRDGGQSYVYLAGPNTGFAETSRVPFGPPDAHIRVAEAADFNADGFIDIVAIDDQRKAAEIYYGKREGTFTTAMSLSGNTVVPYALGVVDLNGDGKIDIVVGNVEARPVIYFNGGFTKFSPVPFGDDKGAAYGFAIADLDNDGSPDIAIARSEAPNVVYFGSREAPVAPQRKQ